MAQAVILFGGGSVAFESLARVVSRLPKTIEASIAVALHADIKRSEEIATALRDRTELPVVVISEGSPLTIGAIALAPPGMNVVVRTTGVFGIERVEDDIPYPSIDMLFLSAAKAYKKHVIGVVLAGEGRDGTKGLRSVKMNGGITVVQSPVDAKAPQMPSRAISGDSPDYIVFLDQMPNVLVAAARKIGGENWPFPRVEGV